MEWILAGLKALTGFSGAITSISNAIANERIAQINATTEQEKIAAGERISALEQRRAVLIAEAGTKGGWINQAIRASFALPFVIYNAKLVIWDKVMAWGSTDPLSTELFQIEMACIGFYFVYETVARAKR